MYPFPESWYDPACPTNMAYRLGENPHYNNYNLGWRTQPDLSWQSQSVVTPGLQITPICILENQIKNFEILSQSERTRI